MCARYEIEESTLKKFPGINLADYRGIRIIRPTNEAPVLTGNSPLPVLCVFKWGFEASWTKSPLINAQSETAHSKPTWRAALKSHRCIIPVSAWIEWKTEGAKKIPHRFRASDCEPIGMAGLWEDSVAGGRFTMLTRDPDLTCVQYHHRMPLVLPKDVWNEWLDPATRDPKAIFAKSRVNDWSIEPIGK